MDITAVELLGDSILKGVQVDPDTGNYCTKNDMDLEGLARRHGLSIRNDSHFGATSARGARLLERLLGRNQTWDAVVMDFGGNDCDMDWAAIAADPSGAHQPNLPLELFLEQYRAMVKALKSRGILPVLATLPPLEPQRFFDWWCRGLDKAAVLTWLGGSVKRIYTHQEQYSQTVEQLARDENVPLVDLRSAFLHHGDVGSLLCSDGTHPNSAGQALISGVFDVFAEEILRAEPKRQFA